MQKNILIVDDEKNTREGLKWALEKKDTSIFLAADGLEALKILQSEKIDLMITDLKMPNMDGNELFKICRRDYPDLVIVILTGHGTIESAVDAMKEGAYSYLIKPVNINELGLLTDKAFENIKNVREHIEIPARQTGEASFENIISKSPQMDDIFRKIQLVAPSRVSILIQGESGTGKELIAEAIYNNSPRKDKSFIKLNCGALTPTLLESELFGHEKGSFTGAIGRKEGRFKLADGGTLFLDEISETSLDLQVKLLRVLQEQEFERVGGVETVKVDVRIITATNRDIEAYIKEGKFREDLYYRLNVVKINVPPLRERREDIPLLVEYFLEKFCKANHKKLKKIEPNAIEILKNQAWHGNVRQLQNVIEGLVVMSTSKTITADMLPDDIKNSGINSDEFIKMKQGISLKDAEKEIIKATLEQTNFNITKTAEILGIGRKTLYLKMEEYNIKDKKILLLTQQTEKK